ncbi:MAG: hypothetical protein KGM42_04155 [Hyphomicrobiales bacterium]|nr:hypothetical protein [Hyphomicrobiales bacterium]
MRLLLTSLAALGLVSTAAAAADALACTGPFGEIADAPAFTVPAGSLGPGESGMTCPPIPSDRTVTAVECLVRIAKPTGPDTVFRCPVGAPCADVGTFQKIERIKGPMGLDQLCATYVNPGEGKQIFGIRATLAR